MPFKKGSEWNGNKNGRPKVPEMLHLQQAIRAYRRKEGKDLIMHAIKRAFESDQVLVALLNKIVPPAGEGGIKFLNTIMVGSNNGKFDRDTQQFTTTMRTYLAQHLNGHNGDAGK